MSNRRTGRATRADAAGARGRWVGLGLFVTLILLMGCQSYGVRTDFDATLRFDALKRFHFEDPPVVAGANPFADNSLMRKRVRSAIETALRERGYQLAPVEDEPDFIVTYRVLLEDEVRVEGETVGTGVGYRRRFGAAYTTTRVNSYQEATLVVDVLLPESRDLAWRGWGSRMLSTRDRARTEEQLLEGVRAIVAKLPTE